MSEPIYRVDHVYGMFSPHENGEVVVCLTESWTIPPSTDVSYRIRILRSAHNGENNAASWGNAETPVSSARFGAIATHILKGLEIEFLAYCSVSNGHLYIRRKRHMSLLGLGASSQWDQPTLVYPKTEPSAISMELAFDRSAKLVIAFEHEGAIYRTESRDFGYTWTPARRVTPVDVGVDCSYPTLCVFPGDWTEWIAVYEEDNTRWALYRSHGNPNDQPTFTRVAYIVTAFTSDSGSIEWVDGESDRLTFVTWDTINQRINRFTSQSGGKTWSQEAFYPVE